jgi:hypothetical protein
LLQVAAAVVELQPVQMLTPAAVAVLVVLELILHFLCHHHLQ